MYCFGQKLHRGWGYSDYFFYKRRLRLFFWVQNFEFQYFRVFFQKNEYFSGTKILWIFFGVITKLAYIKVSFLCILGSFLIGKVQNGGYFFILKFQIFFGGA